MTASKTNAIALFKRHPNTSPSTLVMYNRTYSLGELSYAYYESALVVANQFDGQAKSDIFLRPYLFLMRHAFELLLKDGILILKNIQIEFCAADPKAIYENKEPLEYIEQGGHNLMRLLNEFKNNFNTLELEEEFPRAIESVLSNLHQADSKSTEFRYGIQTDIDPSYIDSASLCKELSEQFHKLEIVIDYAYGTAKDRYTTQKQNDLTAQVDIALTATDTISRNSEI